MSYPVIFCGNSTNSKRVLNIQLKIIRIMAGVKGRLSYREHLKEFNIPTLATKFSA
jgi:hypothetical protein